MFRATSDVSVEQGGLEGTPLGLRGRSDIIASPGSGDAQTGRGPARAHAPVRVVFDGALKREVGAARERFGDGASAEPRVARNGDTMVGTDDEGRKGLADEARSLRLWGGRMVSRRGVHGLGYCQSPRPRRRTAGELATGSAWYEGASRERPAR